MALLRSNLPNQLLSNALPVLSAVIFDGYDSVPDYIPRIFNMMPLNEWGTQTLTEAGIKAAGQKSEGASVEFDDIIEGYSKTYQAVTYAIATSMSEELIEDDRQDTAKKTFRSLGQSMGQTRQVVAFNVLNDGFTDTGPDGVSLFNTAHPMIGGHTYANRPDTEITLST